MIVLLIASLYLLIGACYANIIDEFICTDLGTTGILAHTLLWPISVLVGGVTR